MTVSKRHIEGATEILGAASGAPTSAIVIPLLQANGTWVITGMVQAMRADGNQGPVTFFPRFTGKCAGGVPIPSATGKIMSQPADAGASQGFQPGGLTLIGPDERGQQLEIALTGMPEVPIFWSWVLDIMTFTSPS